MHYLCQSCKQSFPREQLFTIHKQVAGETLPMKVCSDCRDKHEADLERTRQNFQEQFGEKVEAKVAQTKLVTKICIFSDKDAANVQKWVNKFIKDKKVIDIKYQAVVYNDFPNGSAVVDRVLVVYEEEKCGKWRLSTDEDGYEYGICSLCGHCDDTFSCGDVPKYCSECGAKMEEEKEDDQT